MSVRKKTSQKSPIPFVITIALIVIFLILSLFHTDEEVNRVNLEYISGCGYTVWENPVDIAYVSIPDSFDPVYTAYNNIISEAGFDLSGYRGKTVTRYSYRLQEDDGRADGHIRINIFVYRGEIIASDISSLEKGGFVRPLSKIQE